MGMRGLTKGLTMKLGQGDSASLLNFTIEPLRNGETLSTLPLPLLEARPHLCQRRGAICIDLAGPVGIGWRKHPWRECSHLDRGDRRNLEGYRECWCTLSLQPHLAPVSFLDIGQKVHQKPPSGIDHGDRRWSQCPAFLPHSICNQDHHWVGFPTYFLAIA